MQYREGSDIVHFALALHGGSRALSWAQLAPCIILLLMRRVASARFWGHRGRMMSGSTTPSIHNQRLIGMHQHYWAQRYRLSKSVSGDIGSPVSSGSSPMHGVGVLANHILTRAPDKRHSTARRKTDYDHTTCG